MTTQSATYPSSLMIVCMLASTLHAWDDRTPQAHPLLAEDLKRIAMDRLDNHQYFEALRLLDSMMSLDEEQVSTHVLRAKAYSMLGEFRLALADFNRAVELARQASATLIRLRAEAAFRAGDFKTSVESFDQFVKMQPSLARTLEIRAWSLYYAGEYERAAKQCELTFDPFSDHGDLALIQFLCNLRLHGLEVAVKRSLTLKPAAQAGHFQQDVLMMDVFRGHMTPDAMLSRCKIAPPFGRSEATSRVMYFLGLWHEAHGRTEEAKEYLVNAFKSRPYWWKEMRPIDLAVNVHHWLLSGRPAEGPREPRKTIAYVVDCSGSTINTLPFMLDELKRSINNLSEQQAFYVVFFQNGRYHEPVGSVMRSITSESRTKLFKSIDIESGQLVPQGGSDPRAALRRAFETRPVLVFVLSDGLEGRGRFEQNQHSLREDIRRLNKHQVKINCIQFLHDVERVNDADWSPILKHIATDSGGHYKYVSPRDLHIRE